VPDIIPDIMCKTHEYPCLWRNLYYFLRYPDLSSHTSVANVFSTLMVIVLRWNPSQDPTPAITSLAFPVNLKNTSVIALTVFYNIHIIVVTHLKL
jgi:hypothetical protein